MTARRRPGASRRLPAFACVALLCGCDFTAGVSRFHRLGEPPSPVCVEATLRRVPGVTDVKYASGEINGRPLHQFAYRAEGVEVRLDIERVPDRPGHRPFHVLFSTVPPPELVARLRPIMERIDRALEADCGMKGLAQGVTERCARGLFRASDCDPSAADPPRPPHPEPP